ncbi:MAG TPA: metallophosphoesterase [Herpetosiphonaceae bacterium]
MRLFATSDLHVSYPANRAAVQALPDYPDDWLIVAGDIGDTEAQIAWGLDQLARRFARVFWTPGNHDLWSLPQRAGPTLQGEALYHRLVDICRDLGVTTPEDPFVTWPGPGRPYVLAPIFTLYDYSFRPDTVPAESAVAWAAEAGIVCSDEYLLHSTPYPSRAAWCLQRCRATVDRLLTIPAGQPVILISHFPLRRDLAILPRIPRFSIWCGTRQTEDWPALFNAPISISGHLHIRGTTYRQGRRFEEVSFGYPTQWDPTRSLQSYLRQILPE